MWRVNTLRLTVFPGQNAEIPDAGQPTWWSQLVGEAPSNRNFQPKKALFQESGPFNDGELKLNVTPIRIDWKLTPVLDEEDLDILPTISNFEECVASFCELMTRWFAVENSFPVKRLAFGAILFDMVDNREEGYRRLAGYLPAVKINSENSADFLYQINRPRISTTEVQGLSINRLTKWAVAQGQVRAYSLLPNLTVFSPGAGQFACMLELDLSTDNDFIGELPNQQLSPIFNELVQLGLEISQQGDIV